MELSYTVEKENDWERIRLTGDINEDAELPLERLHSATGSKCLIHFKGVTSVNSCGVRSWINFLRIFNEKRELLFEECTPEVVSQLNMIPSFKGNAKIKSVYAGYSCDDCGHEEWVLFEDGDNMPETPEDDLPEQHCPKCSTPMEMDDLEEEFFGWLEG